MGGGVKQHIVLSKIFQIAQQKYNQRDRRHWQGYSDCSFAYSCFQRHMSFYWIEPVADAPADSEEPAESGTSKPNRWSSLTEHNSAFYNCIYC